MNNILKYGAIAILGFTLTACSNTMVKLPIEQKERSVPKWYLKHKDTGKEGIIFRNGFYYAVAVAVSPDMEMSLKKSTLKAKAKIADRINGEMNNKTFIEYTEKGSAEQMTGMLEAQDIIVNAISDTLMRTYSVEKKITVYNPGLNNYRSFVLIKLSKKDVEDLIKSYNSDKAIEQASEIKTDIKDISKD
jgi:hypothetical protein